MTPEEARKIVRTQGSKASEWVKKRAGIGGEDDKPDDDMVESFIELCAKMEQITRSSPLEFVVDVGQRQS